MNHIKYHIMFTITLTIFLLSGCQGGSNNPLVSEEIVSPATVGEELKPVDENNTDNACSPEKPEGTCAEGLACVDGSCVTVAQEPADGEDKIDNACSPEKPEGTCAEGLACVDGSCVAVTQEPTDTDGDRVPDYKDNCASVANPVQEDTYGSKEQGDACDLTDPLQACIKHAKWWKIDDYEKWKSDPAAYGVACTKYVDKVARVLNADGSELKPFNTIQEAVDKAGPGDVICVKPGVYQEHYWDKSLTYADRLKTFYYIDDDYAGVVINHGGEIGRPLIIAALGEKGSVVLDGEKKRDAGIRIAKDRGIDCTTRLIPLKGIPTTPPVQFVEIHGLEIKNYKILGVENLGSCTMVADSHIHNNGNVFPSMVKKIVPGDLTTAGRTNNIDDDGDGLIDEVDEKMENWEYGARNNIGDEECAVGNIYRKNDIHDSGIWHQKGACGDPAVPGCPDSWGLERCRPWPAEDPGQSLTRKGTCMYLRGSNVVVEGNKIHGCTSAFGIDGRDYVSGYRVIDNEIYDNAEGIIIGIHSGHVIEGNYIHDTGVCTHYAYNISEAIKVCAPSNEPVPGVDIKIRNNRFEKTAGFDIWIEKHCPRDGRTCVANADYACPSVIFEDNTVMTDGSRVPADLYFRPPFADSLCGKAISRELNHVVP